MSELWGPVTESYAKVLAARWKFVQSGSFADLEVAWKLFVEAAHEDDVFARFDLSMCNANPLRAAGDIHATVILRYHRPIDFKERAAKGYLIPLLALSDEERAALWPHISSTTRRALKMTVPYLLAYPIDMTHHADRRLLFLWLSAFHYQHFAIRKLVEIMETDFPSWDKLVYMGRFFQACKDAGKAVEMPLSWHTSDAFQYWISSFTRFRLHSKSPKLLCTQSDNACRRAVLYWMWAPLPVVKDAKRMIAQMVWESRYELSVWVRTEMIAPEKRLKA